MSHLFLTGFMGAGKSTVGRLVAERLGRPFIDLDSLIEERESATVSELFRMRGEDGFRLAEHDALASLGAQPDAVIATGGGVVLREDNRVVLPQLGVVVYLAVTPEEVIARLGDAADRPLLAGAGLPAARAILDARLSLYTSTSDHVVDTVGRSPELVAADVVAAVSGAPSGVSADLRVDSHAGGGYGIFVAPGALDSLGIRVRGELGRVHVVLVSDETVFGLFGSAATASLEAAELRVSTCLVPPGEMSKSWTVAGGLLEEFAAHGADRGSCVVALGGGVVGDLAGFCAATYMRGIPVVQVPTTLLAQVDSSIGGKTGVDLAAGKNLAGAFWPPKLVLSDTAVLGGLPGAEWTNGLVEAAKAALLEGEDALARFESRVGGLLARDPVTVQAAVAEAAAFKAGIVSADLREADVRECLNLGHTLGHALEVTAGYDTLPHGLAVAEGMRFAAVIAERELQASPGLTTRTGGLLDALGASHEVFVDRVAAAASALTPEAILHAMKSDKKARAGVVRFILVERPGLWRVVPVDDVTVLELLAGWRSFLDREV
ncbi:MAG: bifunctional shikimate kinase/3-dehydroquinate synthase [Coriobacteriia bacterium]|nr:bifunctional shikimate kinase/3-dehydroquinate synthase [Coriobacteriia bacterium]